MAKSQDAKKTEKKEPLKTAKEKKEEKREKKNNPKRDYILFKSSITKSDWGFFLRIKKQKLLL